ncbi:MAG: hypothetical protein QOI73_2868, partial [Solirubrobacteraceae bacterium]|nr:hypothetical protein [Solirubrobacteraceae bacterium]
PAEPAAAARSTARSPRSRERPSGERPAPSRFDVRDGVPRPHAIWAPFPLTELGMVAGIAILAAGYVSDGRRAAWLLGIGAVVLAVVTAELSLREHFAGFRSHTLLLALLPVVALHATIVLAITDAYGGQLALLIDAVAAGLLGWWLHGRFPTSRCR